MRWDTYEERCHQGKSYFHVLTTPMGLYGVNLTNEASIYIPTVGVWSDDGKKHLLSLVQERVNEVDASATTEYIGRLSVFVIKMEDERFAEGMLEEVKEVVEGYAIAKLQHN